MVNTVISDIASRILQNEAVGHITTAMLGEDCLPGKYCVRTSIGWVKATSSTAAHKVLSGGVCDWRKRVNSNEAYPTIDEIVDISLETNLKNWHMVTDGIVAGWIVDQVATVLAGTLLQLSTTAGDLTKYNPVALNSYTTVSPAIAKLLTDVVSGDLVAMYSIGKGWRGAIY